MYIYKIKSAFLKKKKGDWHSGFGYDVNFFPVSVGRNPGYFNLMILS
jgi:hypothetical protein